MRTERPRVDARLREVVGKLGYAVRGTNDEHSGQTYRLRYGDEHIKIDVTYLARVALLEPVELSVSDLLAAGVVSRARSSRAAGRQGQGAHGAHREP